VAILTISGIKLSYFTSKTVILLDKLIEAEFGFKNVSTFVDVLILLSNVILTLATLYI
jgi:hypothetical protein